MKILITGATGTVGAAVAQTLADSGHDIAVLVRDPGRYDTPKTIEVESPDVENRSFADDHEAPAFPQVASVGKAVENR